MVEAELHPRYLTRAQRAAIADLRRGGQSLWAMGRALGRPASPIQCELDAYSIDGVYRQHAAQRARARTRPKDSKPARDGPLRDYVTARPAQLRSPEQICLDLVEKFPPDDARGAQEKTTRGGHSWSRVPTR